MVATGDVAARMNVWIRGRLQSRQLRQMGASGTSGGGAMNERIRSAARPGQTLGHGGKQ